MSLSIIIPCYNCSSTLEEAVNSCFKQNLKEFEIILVDDCSTDNTREIMSRLSNKYPEVKLFYHEKNKGGGATRNTAVSKTKYDVIFCLDSDDALGEKTLSKMLTYLQKNNCDGVGVSTSIKFKGTNLKDVAFINNFSRVGEKIQFKDLFETQGASCSLYSVFMHTKKAFNITGGYPTDHGFDTQSFAFRFLANGLNAHTCPDTTYFHRIAHNPSYYIREYESGKVNHNWFKIYDEFIYFFTDHTKELLLNFNLNNSTSILNSFINKQSDLLVANHENFLKPETKSIFSKYVESKKDKDRTKYDWYWLGSEALRANSKTNALKYFEMAFEKGMNNMPLLVKIKETGINSDKVSKDLLDKAVNKFYSYKKQGSKASIVIRVLRKIKKIIIKE